MAPLIRWHHERHDGRGYPDRLRGEELPFEVALISVCDAWDAITHDRHYRAGRGAADAEAILRGGAGSQCHPRAVDIVLEEVRVTAVTGGFEEVGALLRNTTPAEAAADEVVRAEAVPAAASSPERFQQLFEQAPMPYFTVAASGTITSANANACAGALMGVEASQLIGMHVLDLCAPVPDGRPRATELLARFARGLAIEDEELVMRRHDGSLRWVRVTAVPVLDARGRVVESRSIAVDITERRAEEATAGHLMMVD